MVIPIVPATPAFDTAGTPFSPEYGDVYHSADSGPGQARHVFLGGNELPARWSGARVFTIVETGFGLGLNFLATWDAWRVDPARPERLHYVSIEKHPFLREGLADQDRRQTRTGDYVSQLFPPAHVDPRPTPFPLLGPLSDAQTGRVAEVERRKELKPVISPRVLNGDDVVRSNTGGLRSAHAKSNHNESAACVPTRSHPQAGTCSALRHAPNRRAASGFNSTWRGPLRTGFWVLLLLSIPSR